MTSRTNVMIAKYTTVW